MNILRFTPKTKLPPIVKPTDNAGLVTKNVAAASLRWYRDTFGEDYVTLTEKAKDVPLGCDGLMFHPYLNGELTPYADPTLCGSFTGVRATHTKVHFTRAVLEVVALYKRKLYVRHFAKNTIKRIRLFRKLYFKVF